MQIKPFLLERYFARHEFSASYLLSSSDCEALGMFEILAMADDETKQLWQELRLGYTESPGHPLLRQGISSIYKNIHSEDILVLAPEEGIFLLMHALLQPGDHVICTFPAYQSLYEVARSIGCRVSTWHPQEENGWQFDLEELTDKIQADTKLVVVNFPNNPTGFVPKLNDFQNLVELLRQRDIWLLSDEMYRFLELQTGTTLPAACELYERAFSLSGLSKSFGMPGLRIGWLASRDHQTLSRVSELRDYTTICSSAPSEILAIIGLDNWQSIINSQLERINRNIATLDNFFKTYSHIFSCNRPLGGSICFPRMHISQNTFDFCEKLVQETGIMLVPSRMFQFGERHVRIGFGREDLPQVLEIFADYLESKYGQDHSSK